ncbi:hypothetical protein DR66_2585 [Delftia acidovorans]|uniref:hypothetical protein n=1 Tax=Delftia acidovorans TaxID=80866 RepID=UPI000508B0B2|nr:hypothetical protein [Delftia acidovorans]KFJ11144.1 hypothetical protein DR66_2585 [Delftia acidovorans]QQB52772.1 hypothetical protein I6H54_11130 [Delftia acidovorans]
MTDIVTPPTISALPPAPLATDTPTEFDAKAFAMVAAQVGFVPQANALASNVFNNATAAFERTAIAQAAASAASGSASAAAGSASGASGSASAAASSASTASSAAGTATAALTAMQVMYLGSKAVNSHPATDNMGNPLQAGALYTNTGTNAALNKRGWWWDGAAWQLAWGDITGVYMPTTGGTFTGPINVPAGATGNQAPRVSEVFKKAPDAFNKTKPMGELDVGYALFTTTSGRGGDWPPETYDDPNQAWLVETTGGAGRAKQVATQLLTTTSARIQNSTWQRSLEGTTWGAWDRVITARTAMDQQVTANVPAGTTTYTLDPNLGGSHIVTINGSCTFNLPAGRQYGDQVALDVVSAGAIRPISFSANVAPPRDGTGAQLPFPTYSTGAVVSFLFRCILVNRWECYYAGVH